MALVKPNHPDIKPLDLVGYLAIEHFKQATDELTRQLLAAMRLKGGPEGIGPQFPFARFRCRQSRRIQRGSVI